jgi:ribonuclease III
LISSGPSVSPDALAKRLGIGVDPDLLRLAVVHRSYCAESPGEEPNERLEFLGDAVLGLVVTAHLFRTFPDLREGDLARIKAAVVSSATLSVVARELGLGAALLLGRGEENSGGREKPSLLADCLEAVIGAVYISSGLVAAESFVLEHLGESIEEEATRSVLGDAKNVLQELAAQLGLEAPAYRLSDHGPEHAKVFTAEVDFGALHGHGEGRSKKEAERHAAMAALASYRALEEAGQGRARA